MVIEVSSLLSTRGKTIADVANRLTELFPDDFENLVHSILLVVSKVDREKLRDITKEISEIVNTNKNISDIARMVMLTLV